MNWGRVAQLFLSGEGKKVINGQHFSFMLVYELVVRMSQEAVKRAQLCPILCP
jgi:hypothetical protein